MKSKRKITSEKVNATRQAIRSHLKRNRSYDAFEVTETVCLYWWHRLNIAVFDGKLTPPVRFEIRAFRNTMGWCRPWRPNSKQPRVVIGISSEMLDRKEFLSVLVHEMVHQWQWEISKEWLSSNSAHGRDFFSWAPKIRYRVGLPLQVSY